MHVGIKAIVQSFFIICKPRALFQLKNTTDGPFNKHAHKPTYNRYSKVPGITEPREELFTLKTI